MNTLQDCFTLFNQDISHYQLPVKFTFPFYYDPDPIALLAAKQLQQYLATQKRWQHNFGLSVNDDLATAAGKMFGVLVVQNTQGQLGYLSAFSGKLADQSVLPHFVPPVFEFSANDSFFAAEQQLINQLNDKLCKLENDTERQQGNQALVVAEQAAEQAIQKLQKKMAASRKIRKSLRAQANNELTDEQLIALKQKLAKESVSQKNELKALKQYWQDKIAALAKLVEQKNNAITALKAQRKQLSNSLQHYLFAQYQFLNNAGVKQDLNALFKNTASHIPPAGAGDCAAPKLLQYAFKNQLTPIALAEFWWGASPKSAVRRHGDFYPACRGKCEPILKHMLLGIELDDNPLLINPAENKSLPIVYQDDDIVVVNKPAEFLSVPGKTIKDSVYERIKQLFPQASGGIIVHRLDMSTSGLLVLALHQRAHKGLQRQFVNRSVEKRYIALLSGKPHADEGSITLPLRLDLDDRPKQLVCEQYGKPAETYWQLVKPNRGQAATEQALTSDNNTKVYLYPKTGRTHQLRVHCAHVLGLNLPIVGDDLYGTKAERLCLHAQSLSFEHPVTKEKMYFEVDEDF